MDIVEVGVGVLAGGLLLAGIVSPMFLDDESPAGGPAVAAGEPALAFSSDGGGLPLGNACPDDGKGRDVCDPDDSREGKRHHEPRDKGDERDDERDRDEEEDDDD
jgi:hypothetical protein